MRSSLEHKLKELKCVAFSLLYIYLIITSICLAQFLTSREIFIFAALDGSRAPEYFTGKNICPANVRVLPKMNGFLLHFRY